MLEKNHSGNHFILVWCSLTDYIRAAMKTNLPVPESNGHGKRVGIWIRVSTDDQAQGDSPAHHEQRARDYAKFNGWTVVEVYDLAGVSGKSVMQHTEAK